MANAAAGREYKYKAFISYSQQDKKWGDWLHKALETYRIPKRLIGTEGRDGPVGKRLFPIFRDREELSVSTDLPANINAALKDSACLIVICSPRSAASWWVNEEIKTFKALGRGDRVLPLIVDGEPNADDKPELGLSECFPEALKYRVNADKQLLPEPMIPMAADLRPGKNSRPIAKLKLVAGIMRIPFDALMQRDLKRQKQRIAAWIIAAALIISAFLTTGITSYLKVKTQRHEAQTNLASAYVNMGHWFKARKQFDRSRIYYASALALDDSESSRYLLNNLEVTPFSYHNRLIGVGGKKPGAIRALAFSPDGKTVATGNWDNSVKTWDARTAALERTFEGHQGPVYKVAYNPDGKSLASAGADGRVIIWDFSTGKAIRTFTGGSGEVYDVSFNPKGDLVAALVGDTLRIWSIATGTVEFERSPYTSFAFSPDDSRIALGWSEECLVILDTATWEGQLVENTCFPHRRFNELRFSHNGEFLAGGLGSSIEIRASGSWKVVRKFTQTPDSSIMAFSNDDHFFAYAGIYNTAKVWRIGKEEEVMSLEGHSGIVSAIAFNPVNSSYLALASLDHTVDIWEIPFPTHTITLEGFNEAVQSLAFSPDGRSLAAGSDDGTVRVWEISASQDVPDLMDECYRVENPGVPVSRGLEVGCFSGCLRTLEPSTGATSECFQDHYVKDSPEFSFLSPDGKTMVTGDMKLRSSRMKPDGEVVVSGNTTATDSLWDVGGRTRIAYLENVQSGRPSFAFSPNGRWLAAGGQYRKVKVWNRLTGQLAREFQGHSEPIIQVAFNEDSTILVSSSEDQTIKAWRMDQPGTDPAWSKPVGNDVCVTVNPRYNLMVTDSAEDNKLQLWDLSSGRIVVTTQGFDNWVHMVTFSPEGNIFVTVGSDQRARIWDALSGDMLRTIDISNVPEGNLAKIPRSDYLSYPGIAVTHNPYINFTPDGRFFISSPPLIFWRVSDWEAVLSFPEINNDLHSVVFSRDMQYFIIRTYSEQIIIWPLLDKIIKSPPQEILERTQRETGLKVIGIDVFPYYPTTGKISDRPLPRPL